MEQVVRHDVIGEVTRAIDRVPLVTLSAPAGGGVTTVLRQLGQAAPSGFTACPDLNPQRPLAAFTGHAPDVFADARSGSWAAAARRIADGSVEDSGALLIDDADRIDGASARLTIALLESGRRVVMGHHHAPSTNPSLERVLGAVPSDERATLVVPPFTEREAELAYDGDIDVHAALSATGGNPLALSLYRGPGFASVATAVLERFDRLPADGQALTALLAASPEPVPFDLLETLGRPWEAHATHLERSGLVVECDDAVSLRHDKIRRILYEELTPARRLFVHAELLPTVAESADLTLVMHHAVGAGDVAMIVTAGPAAADEAARAGAHREAARHLENVLKYEHSVPEADRPALREALEAHLAAAGG